MNVIVALSAIYGFITIVLIVLIFVKKVNPGIKFITILLYISFLIYSLFKFQVFDHSEFIILLSRFFIDPIQLIYGPLVYLLFRWLVLPQYSFERRDFRLMLPFALVLIINIFLVSFFSIDNLRIFSDEEGIGNYSNYLSFSIITATLIKILYILQTVFYGMIMIFLVIKKGSFRELPHDRRRIFKFSLWFYVILFILFSSLDSVILNMKDNIFILVPDMVLNIIFLLYSGIFILITSLVYEKSEI